MAAAEHPPLTPELEVQLQDVPRWCSWLRLLWCDVAGVRRCRVIPATRIRDAAHRGVGLTQGCMASAAHSDSPVAGTGLSADGETNIVPDLSTLRQIPWRESHYVAHVDMRYSSGKPWEFCPRSALRRTLAALQSEFGITMKVGCELEFYLLAGAPDRAKGEDILPLDDSKYCQSASADAAMEDLEAIVTAVQRLSGLSVQQLHAEGGGGQFELAMAHTNALDAADALVLQREAVVDTAARRGRPASFLPKLWEGRSASGSHIHFSLWKDDENLMSGGAAEASCHGLQEAGEQFLAGVLRHLPGIAAFLAASPNSYRRLTPSVWAGAFQVWGVNNREAALRLIPDTGGRANCELKMMDGTANPHLAIAAVATAGLLGLRQGSRLPAPIRGDPAAVTEVEQMQRGIRRLPSSLRAAVDSLFDDTGLVAGLHDTIGEPLLMAYTAVKRHEAEHFRDATLDSERRLLWHRY